MGLTDLQEAWRTTRLSATRRREEASRMERVWAGDLPEQVLGDIHDHVRSSIRLHTRVHWVDLRLRWRSGQTPSTTELQQLVIAPLSSLGRRLAGLDASAPTDNGLWSTWRRVGQTATR